jgi:hypothetical protein
MPRFAIIGSGGVGGYFGARLARAGQERSAQLTAFSMMTHSPPTTIGPLSAVSTAPNPTEESGPSVTSPQITAVGAIRAVASMTGRLLNAQSACRGSFLSCRTRCAARANRLQTSAVARQIPREIDARAYGSSAHLLMKRETAYGQAATGNYIRMPFNRCNLGSGHSAPTASMP